MPEVDADNDPWNGGIEIVPAVPSSEGVADVFAWSGWPVTQFSAITADGVTAWSSGLYFFAADFLGGALALEPDPGGGGLDQATPGLVRLDGITGQPTFTYNFSYPQSSFMWAVPHPDGTIFLLEYDNVWGGHGPDNGYFTLKGLDPATGSVKWSVQLPSGVVLNDSDDWADFWNPEGWGKFIIAGDGYAYLPYAWTDAGMAHLILARVSSSGEYTPIPIADYSWPWVGWPDLAWSIMTNADQGVVFAWGDDVYGAGGQYATAPYLHMAIANAAGVQAVNGALIPGQVGPVRLRLQAQDGSLAGVVWDNSLESHDGGVRHGRECAVGRAGRHAICCDRRWKLNRRIRNSL